jgi:two-component system NtrC family sensor kinase
MLEEPKGSAAFPRLNLAAVNEKLMLGLVRQHEQTEAAEDLVTLLRAESLARQKAEAALVNSEKLASVGRMAAVLAHEINNPLSAVMNTLYLAKLTEGLPADVLQYLETAEAELKRVAHITRQTLGFYREQAAPLTFKVATLLDSVVDLLQAKVTAKRATIDIDCNPQLEVTAFQGELRQVVSNLLLNSLDAISDAGKVRIKASLSTEPGDHFFLRVTVADNGQGIERADFNQLFKPFFTTKGTVGNGLGLWVSKRIIEKHGGSIRARSCASGLKRGTTFSIRIPNATTHTRQG